MSDVKISIFKKPNLGLSDQYLDHLYGFAEYITTKLPFEKDVNIYLWKKGENPNCTTGVYDPKEDTVNAVAEGRALPDIMKTVAHEMVHKKQNEQGQINDSYTQIGGFAEGEANIKAGNFVKMYVLEKNAKEIYTL
jgi:hypothetical protein